MDPELRERLHGITLNLNVELHAARIEALRAEIPHTVFVRESCAPTDRYTCGVYVFDLIEDPTYIDIASFGMGTTYAGKEFIDYLLRTGLLAEKAGALITAGDLIMYFQDRQFKHVGRMQSASRVISKWGTGLLYEHDTWEVPADYGETIRYYQGPDKDESLELFLSYAKSRGFRFEET
jgi:hypothetical protein